MAVRIGMYSDTAYTHHFRNDVCRGELTEGNQDCNFHDQECQPENDPGTGCQRIWPILNRE